MAQTSDVALIINVSGDGADQPGLDAELREIFAGEVRPAPLLGGLTEVWRFAVDLGPNVVAFGPTVKTGLEVAKLAIEIVDKLYGLLKRRSGLSITIPSRDGPIKVDGASRALVEALIERELARRPEFVANMIAKERAGNATAP